MNISFDEFFQAETKMFLLATLKIALAEDGPDLTSDGVFEDTDMAMAHIVAKQDTVIAGTPIIPLVLEVLGVECQCHLNVDEGDRVPEGTLIAILQGPTRALLKAERVILNMVCHLSGIAELTSQYVAALKDSKTTLLDTRKTTPGLRYAEKYAVLCGGGSNHRKNLVEMLMLKDNHIDRAGSITSAVEALRSKYSPCPPIEVECRTLADVEEAVDCEVERIMLDNMSEEEIKAALGAIPASIESEVSGNVTLETIAQIAEAGPDFISVGRLTHSAPASDLSMQISETR